jgi:hypothetical protein
MKTRYAGPGIARSSVKRNTWVLGCAGFLALSGRVGFAQAQPLAILPSISLRPPGQITDVRVVTTVRHRLAGVDIRQQSAFVRPPTPLLRDADTTRANRWARMGRYFLGGAAGGAVVGALVPADYCNTTSSTNGGPVKCEDRGTTIALFAGVVGLGTVLGVELVCLMSNSTAEMCR